MLQNKMYLSCGETEDFCVVQPINRTRGARGHHTPPPHMSFQSATRSFKHPEKRSRKLSKCDSTPVLSKPQWLLKLNFYQRENQTTLFVFDFCILVISWISQVASNSTIIIFGFNYIELCLCSLLPSVQEGKTFFYPTPASPPP